MDNIECFFKDTWIDAQNSVVTFCYARGHTIPYGLCKMCEKRQKMPKKAIKQQDNKGID